MLCNKCKKNEANIYYTEIISGEKKEQHLCDECALEYTSFQSGTVSSSKEVTLGSLLSTILGNYYNPESGNTKKEIKELRCKECGNSYSEFTKKGRFGCSECYNSFQSLLSKSLSNLHGANVHVGKKPIGFVSKTQKLVDELSELDKLAIRLQDAIEKEEFEEAVKLRDKIRFIKEEEKNNA